MPALWASTQRSTWRHQRSPGSSPLKRISGRGVDRSLPRERLNSRNSAVALMQTRDRKSTRLNSSHMSISYAVFCLKKKKKKQIIKKPEKKHNIQVSLDDNTRLQQTVRYIQ